MGGFFSKSKSFNPATDFPDLTGKVILVTGANTGLGYHIVKYLARKGAKVYLGARNESKATGAMAQLDLEGLGPGNGEIKWLKVDFTDPRKAKAAAEDFMAQESKLDVLVNNAGGTLVGSGKTEDGIEEVMMVNHISTYVFTETLLPLLTKTAKQDNSDVRIVNVSSTAHEEFVAKTGIRYRDREDLNQQFLNHNMPFMARYGYAKLANLLYTKSLQRRLDAESIPIICTASHPGSSATGGVMSATEHLPVYFRPVFLLFTLFFSTPEVGAYNLVFGAASPVIREKFDLYKGAFVGPVGKIDVMSENALNQELEDELAETTVKIVNELGI